jgi:hypothetical protein
MYGCKCNKRSSSTFLIEKCTVANATKGAGTWVNSNSLSLPYVAKTATYAILSSDYTIDCTANTFTVTLPTAVGIAGRVFNIKNSGAGIITLDTTSSQTIDGLTSQTINAPNTITVQSTGANWIII